MNEKHRADQVEAGDHVGGAHAGYTVIDPAGFGGTLPTAVISSRTNRGVKVILTGPRVKS